MLFYYDRYNATARVPRAVYVSLVTLTASLCRGRCLPGTLRQMSFAPASILPRPRSLYLRSRSSDLEPPTLAQCRSGLQTIVVADATPTSGTDGLKTCP
ncbi:hypothetical protein EVAR_78425_1 [Eumeta japonica]|uniref:Uncharacterized protein n=1 Tax=Eumeta variegata TaxID=151549 RepID=A0A4C1TY62_EUMVA|nr:hypothetical protein EVAR_78425_1 [Eumeta japonica]